MPLVYRPLTDEHKRAQEIKAKTHVLVCIGNPPYDRQVIDPDDPSIKRKGGWVRNGDNPEKETPILDDFLEPARRAGAGGHLKNLYNDYVYFWRWAIWKVFETSDGPGIVSFITAASYVRGPGFVGMREVMRRTFDEMWIIDLGGDSRGTRKSENVFAIQTPVAIAVGVRYGAPKPSVPADIHYSRVDGNQDEKLDWLAGVDCFKDLAWQTCYKGWHQPLLPEGTGEYFAWPLITDLFPWQQPGIKVGRTWPIAPDKKTLSKRWDELVSESNIKRTILFKNSPTGRKCDSPWAGLTPQATSRERISDADSTAKPPRAVRYGYRSFDRQWILADGRIIDRSSPSLWLAHSDEQVYLISLLTEVLGEGPAATASSEIPDLHFFRGSFGGKNIIPLWRDKEAKRPNITPGVLELLSDTYGRKVVPEAFFGYCYAILASPEYGYKHSEELVVPGPRIPATKEAHLFYKISDLGQKLLWLHTFGQRLVPKGIAKGYVPPGSAKCLKSVGQTTSAYPERYSYDAFRQQLTVGDGLFGPVLPEVFEFSVSGFPVVRSWLDYRMKKTTGRTSSALDKIRSEKWTAQFTQELLEILGVLEKTCAAFPELGKLLGAATKGDLFSAEELPQPSTEDRSGRAKRRVRGSEDQFQLRLPSD